LIGLGDGIGGEVAHGAWPGRDDHAPPSFFGLRIFD
jgi:hypothetical protein